LRRGTGPPAALDWCSGEGDSGVATR
jgi:hypothetical protein